jgi:hypothetical protein
MKKGSVTPRMKGDHFWLSREFMRAAARTML